MSGAFVGIDVGTSGCKAVLLDGGRVAATAWDSYEPVRGIDGEVSQDPDDWLRAAQKTLSVLAATATEANLMIDGIAVTAPAHAMVLLDRQSRPLARALLPYDTRSAEVAERLAAGYGPDFFARTFVRLGPSWTLPQLAWLRQAQPEIWPRVRRALVTKDYVTFALTGRATTDMSDAAGTALFDQLAGRWADDLCADAGLRPEQLAPVCASTASVGGLSRAWARRTGIAQGTPVAVGATDTACELVALGITEPGNGLVKIASTGTVVTVLDKPRPDPRILTYPHVGGRWYTLTATNAAATAYQWLRQTVHAALRDEPAATYTEMDEVASTVTPGAGGVLFLPFLTGERSPYWDSDLRAAFLGLSAAHRRPHLCRAVLEGVAFSLRDCRDLLAELGIVVAHPYFTGGGVASRLWRTVLASALGTVGTLADPQGPAIGAAMLAAAAEQGSMPSIERTTEPVEPDPAWAAVYDQIYPIYKEAAQCLSGISHGLVRAYHK